MKGDFSRPTFDQKKHYSGVLMQQGRVQTDADWNEQWALGEYRLETEGTDIIGQCGAPIHNAGFAITTEGATVKIGAGRFYVDGILVENEQDGLDYLKQPDFPNASAIAELLNKAEVTAGVVYLDVWLRHVTALDDALIREKALGGPDTTTRVKVMWQVQVLPVQAGGSDSEDCKRLRELKLRLEQKLAELVQEGAPAQDIQAVKDKLASVNARIDAACGAELTCDSQLDEWDALVAPRNVKLNARTQPPQPSDDLCLIPPSAGYQRLENQLYRVEIHQGGALQTNAPGAVTFKWSRDNGTVVTSIEKINGQQITVHDVGPDDVLGFANGQFVEVIDDSLELNGQPGQLIQIDTVNSATREIKLKSAPTLTFNVARHPKLRRWDSSGAVQMTNAWIPLEGGVEVQFSNGDYRSGDYWMIPARTVTGEIEWPPFQIPNTAPEAQPPLGIRHHFCRLAIVRLNGETLEVGEDCRKLFPPLTEIGAPMVAQAMHVRATNWQNDDIFDVGQFLQEGLIVTLDAPPDSNSVSGATMIVTMEIAPPENLATGGATGFNQLVILEGDITVNPSEPDVIIWRPVPDLGRRLGTLLDRENVSFRVRVTLKGHTIWNRARENALYLDGQAFGIPSTRAATNQPRTALLFPSGNQERASDFESWFYFGRREAPPNPLQVRSITFLNANMQPATPGIINVPPIPDVVRFKADERVTAIQIEFSRAVNAEGLGEIGTPQSIRVQVFTDVASPTRLAGNIKIVNETTVQFIARDPRFFGRARYRLVILGSDQQDGPAVQARDDGSALDGDFNNAAGGDFILPFQAT